MQKPHSSVKLQIVLGCALAVSAVLLMWALALSRENWIALDAQQWNAWYPTGWTDEGVPGKSIAYTDVHYRIDEPYEYGQRNGRVTVRTRYNTDLDIGPVGYLIENGLGSRTLLLLKQGLFKASAWQQWRQQTLHDYRWEEVSYEYICPSQEIRRIKTRFESHVGKYAAQDFYYSYGASGWSTGLGDWPSKVNTGDLVPLLNPLAPIWPRLCGEPHFSWELFEQEQQSLKQGHHRIWIPLPDEITDPTKTHVEFEDSTMDICAEQISDKALTCRLLNSGDSPARHAILLMPGRYWFFQRLHGEPQQERCGNLLRGFGNAGPCNDGQRWYWRKTSSPYAPVEVRLQDLGPGTSVGPQISSFSMNFQ
jgi:hypothetical protein